MLDSMSNLAPVLGVAAACRVLGMPRSAYYRARDRSVSIPAETPVSTAGDEADHTADERVPLAEPHAAAGDSRASDGTPPSAASPAARRSPRALSPEERTEVYTILNSERFVDCTPREVYATVLDEGQYLCSWSTMYRILRTTGEVTRRRDQRRQTAYAKPEVLATGPNQLWSWDITTLTGPVTWTSSYLYVIIDVYSRYVVGWMIATRESAALAETLIAETTAKEGILPDQVTLHADRGSAMTSITVTQVLIDLGVITSHSRPSVSDDNPFSEAQFKTATYHPTFPDRFGSLEDARAWARPFFTWYNQDHHHTGIGVLTPATVHRGQAPVVRAARQATLDGAYQSHPERFVRGQPQPPALPAAVWINPPAPPADPPPRDQSPAGDQAAAAQPEPVGVSRGSSGAALDAPAGSGYRGVTASPAETTPHAARE